MRNHKIAETVLKTYRYNKIAKEQQERVRLDGKRRNMSFLSFINNKASNEEVADSDILDSCYLEILENSPVADIQFYSQEMIDRIIEMTKLGRVVVTAVTLGPLTVID